MTSPSSRRFWVGMVVVLVAQIPFVLQKCIFDVVQAQVRVVTAAPTDPEGPPNRPTPRALAKQQTAHPGQKASPLKSQTHRRSLGELAPPTTASPQPIRIRIWIPKESDSLLEAEKDRLEAAVEEAVRIVSSLLSVHRVPGPLLLSRDIIKYCKFLWKNSSTVNYNRCGRANNNYRAETCLDVTIPDDHLAGCDVYPEADSPHRTTLRPEGAGLPDTDFLLYLHVQATDKCRAEQPDVLAYAVHCQTDTHGRPVAGVVVVCRDKLTGAAFSQRTAVQTVIHELFHALGFSKDLFNTWRDCSSSSQAGVGCSLRGKVTHTDGSGQTRIYTPSVISAMQKHLGATDPELGGPLENLDVPPGGVSSHWESRLLWGSIMAAVLGDSTTVRVDPVTLAAFQDTGWYAVNLSRAQSLVWGDGEGVMFGSLSTCQDNSSSFFCAGSGLGCHYLHLHKGECQTDQYLDNCWVYKPLKNSSECWNNENDRRSADQDWSGEIFGLDSRCFFSSLNRESHLSPSSSSVRGSCYRHRCTGPNRYQIQVSGSEWMDCPAGHTIQIKGFQGSLLCPDRRLCLYTDVTPPSDVISAFSASITSGPHETLLSPQDATWSALRPPTELTAAFTAAVCLLAVAMALHRKCCSHRVRIHTVDL